MDGGYVMARTYQRGRFRLMGHPDERARAYPGLPDSGYTREDFTAASPLPEAVTAFLCRLDDKIDAVLAGMAAAALEQDFPYTMEVLAIGASGMEFTAKEPLAPGDFLEAAVQFRHDGFFTVSGIGSVTAFRAEKDGTPVFSFSFSRIREEDRERIIRFVFKEERRLLRETRLERE